MNESQLTISYFIRKAAWERFDVANPHVYEMFKRFACEAHRSRHGRKYGARCIIERMRWHVGIELNSEEEFKLNHNHVYFMVRRLIDELPHLSCVFETRERDSAPKISKRSR